jgi:hypothetical protein
MDAAGQFAQLGRGLLQLRAQPLEERADPRGILGEPAAGDLDVEDEADEPLLRAVVQVALDLAPGGVGGLEDPLARGAQLGGASGLDLVGQQRGLGGAALRDVEQRTSPSARQIRYSRTNGSWCSVECATVSSTISTSSGWTIERIVRLVLDRKLGGG